MKRYLLCLLILVWLTACGSELEELSLTQQAATPTATLSTENPTQTPTATATAAPTSTFFILCTPPACAPDETYHCPGPGACPGGCGTTCATAVPGIASGTGMVSGKLCFSGETAPAMTVYFQTIPGKEILEFSIEENQTSYQFIIPQGYYFAFAKLVDSDIGGAYTQFVLCSKNSSTCTDHSLVQFLAREYHAVENVDICDWDTDQIEFPIIPED